MSKRKGLRAQDRDYKYITSEIKRAAEVAAVRCGCPVNAREADPDKFPCPCGAHCQHPDCLRVKAGAA